MIHFGLILADSEQPAERSWVIGFRVAMFSGAIAQQPQRTAADIPDETPPALAPGATPSQWRLSHSLSGPIFVVD